MREQTCLTDQLRQPSVLACATSSSFPASANHLRDIPLSSEILRMMGARAERQMAANCSSLNVLNPSHRTG